MFRFRFSARKYFYPRSPCGERLTRIAFPAVRNVFLSTLSLRRATFASSADFCSASDFYPRSPCGERHLAFCLVACLQAISIHALLAESDRCAGTSGDLRRNFYPRSPCGERHLAFDVGKITGEFLSTLSLRRATQAYFLHWQGMQISIHALLAESDSAHDIFHALNKHFYPRSPCGERLTMHLSIRKAENFYPRSPCGERPHALANDISHELISIHALLAESDCLTVRTD